MITLPAVAQSVSTGRVAMHVVLALVVLLAVAIPFVLRWRRRHDEPVDRLDTHPAVDAPETEE